MTRITVDVNDEWLDAAREALGTPTKVATINEALRVFAVRRKAAQILGAFDDVPMELAESERAWGYGGGRDLSQLEAKARAADAA